MNMFEISKILLLVGLALGIVLVLQEFFQSVMDYLVKRRAREIFERIEKKAEFLELVKRLQETNTEKSVVFQEIAKLVKNEHEELTKEEYIEFQKVLNQKVDRKNRPRYATS